MASGDAAAEVALLVARLDEAGQNKTRLVALLWTWLERHLTEFGSLKVKPPKIRAQARADPPFEEIDQRTLEWLIEAPLLHPARLLSRIGLAVGESAVATAQRVEGFGGEEVFVFRRRSELVRRTGGPDYPPTASEHPSISTLVPALVVCPALVGGIGLHQPRLEGPEWDAAVTRFERAFREGRPSSFEVDLDSLGEAGFSDWDFDGDLGTAVLRDEDASAAETEEAMDAVHRAIDAARGSADILVMPELAAGREVREMIAEDLAAAPDPPVLTVIGSYHVPVAEADPELADFYNEAIVYGPAGGELWRHRKLTAAGAKVPLGDGERAYVVEDIRLGDGLNIVASPLGTIAVVACLDCFARQGRDRLLASPVNVLLVPSLSPSVKRHRDSLRQLVGSLWGAAFVCNRSPLAKPGTSCWEDAENRSFWAIQRRALEPATLKEGTTAFVFRMSEHEEGVPA